MKNSKLVSFLVFLSVSSGLHAASSATTTTTQTTTQTADTTQKIEQDFDGLGGNRALLEKAQALNPEVHATVVQNRMVDRTHRFEFSGEYANSFGGDTYVRTGTFGVATQFHLSNHWSLGAKYGMSFNKLTSEGEDLATRAAADFKANPQSSSSPIPDIDYPKSMAMGFVNFYPVYGKVSWLGKSISHFDVYGQLGYGSMVLESGSSPAISGGVGVGVWGNENITTRLEMLYTDYTAQYYNGAIKLGVTTASIQIGWLL